MRSGNIWPETCAAAPATRDSLIVMVLRSPHANAMIQSVKTDAAMKVPGIAADYTWEDVSAERITMAGQTYPEPSPYDRLILDRHVRYVGDPVAIVETFRTCCYFDAYGRLNILSSTQIVFHVRRIISNALG